jgi:uncharacterized protein YecE (DUF72 family)
MAEQGIIRVGTSGWKYDHWKENFYPEEVDKSDWLDYYAGQLNTVEINSSFYGLPAPGKFREWGSQVPADFLFSVKASRYITHMKKLRDPAGPLEKFLESAGALQDRLGPVLFQLPPRWGCDTERLERFVDIIPGNVRPVFEFRDRSWWNETVYRLLEGAGAAFCIYHLAGTLSPKEITSDFVYVRLHGPGDSYEGLYDKQALAGWAGAASSWAESGKDVYIYFDNDQNGYAPRNAVQLRDMTGQ